MRRTYLALILLLLCAGSSSAQIIHTIAGGGPGSGIPALSANFSDPLRALVDSSGNFYFVAYTQHRIFKVDTAGNLTLIAGTGVAGFSGDGGLATSANLNAPIGITLDASGNLFIADQGNNRIRKVNTSGIITTVAGNGAAGYNGDGGLATSTSLYLPYGVYADASGNLFIADTYNHRVRKVSPAGIISTIAGTGVASYNGDGIAATTAALQYPMDLLMDGSGNLIIADANDRRIRKINTSGMISTMAGNGVAGYSGDGGAATSAALSFPTGIAMDGSGNLYIADTNNNRIRKVNTSGIITTCAGTGVAGYNGSGIAATSASLYNPWGVAADSVGQLYIPDRYNHLVRKVDTTGKIFDVAGNGSANYGGDGGLATGASLYNPYGVTTDGSGNIYIADFNNYRIRKVDTTGKISTVAGNGIYGFSGDGGLATSASIGNVYRIAVDAAGNLYLADYAMNRVRKVDASGHISTVAGSGCSGFSGDGGPATSACLSGPFALALDGAGNIYFSDFRNYRIRKVNAGGMISTVAGSGVFGFSGDGGPATAANMSYIYGLATDNAGNFYLADGYNYRVRKVNASGIITTVAGNGVSGYSGDGGPATSANLTYTISVAADGLGNIFIGDLYNYRIRKVDPTGKISTVAGTGTYGFSGDGGPATSASMTYPYGLAVDGSGNLFISDVSNNRVRKVDGLAPAPAATLSSSSLDFGHSQVGTQTVAQSVTLTNSGNAPLHVSSISASGDYVESDDCISGPIGPSGYCTVEVSFLPTATSLRTGTLTITDDAGHGPQSVSLTGTGDPAATTVSISAPPVTFPADGSVTVTVGSAGGTVTGSVSLSVDGGGLITQALSSESSVFTITGLSAGDHTLIASYAAGGNFAAGSNTGALHVNKATPIITWPGPGAITYGTPLGATQLNATANVAGAFSYTPAGGTILNAGNGQTLSVNFTPTDIADYVGAAKSVTINVNPAPLTITANDAGKLLNAANPAFTATYNGFVPGQGPGDLAGTLSCTSPALTTSPVGSYPINCSGQTSTNYSIQYAAGTLKVYYAGGGVCYGDLGHSILQPVNVDGSSVFKQKSTVPAKFRVCDATGASVGTAGVVATFNLVRIVNGTAVQTVTEAVDSTTPDAAFRWDSTGQQWIFNISTKNLSANMTYVFLITLNDGTNIPFQLGLK